MTMFPLPDTLEAWRLLDKLVERSPEVGPCRVDRPLVLYGAGKMGHLAAELLQRLGIPVEYAIDRSPPSNRLLDGRIPVLKPEETPREHRWTHMIGVCVVFSPYEPIRTELMAMGWRHIIPFYDIAEAYIDRLPMGNGWFAGPLGTEEVDQIRLVLSGWDDDYSRAAHLQFLAWRMHRDEWNFSGAPVSIDNRYFIPQIMNALGSQEFFLDAGAHHGTVSQRFLQLTEQVCQGIMAIEPDRENAAVLRSVFAKLSPRVIGRCEVMECALGAEEGGAQFHGDLDLASCLDMAGKNMVRVCRLDDLDLQVTFVKLHLEGGELDALRGGMRTLCEQRPLLAVTIYHSREGLWQLPLLLMERLKDYRFLLRLHAWCGTGAVVYGIPAERGRDLAHD